MLRVTQVRQQARVFEPLVLDIDNYTPSSVAEYVLDASPRVLLSQRTVPDLWSYYLISGFQTGQTFLAQTRGNPAPRCQHL
jgi:hypothetical protein